MFEDIIKKVPKLAFLNRPEFKRLPEANQLYLKELIEDALFWINLESKPEGGDGFKFLAATYGLETARADADAKKLEGKEREKFLRPHQDLYTQYNPYSGNGRDS